MASSLLAVPGDLSSPYQSRKGSDNGCLYSQVNRVPSTAVISVIVTSTSYFKVFSGRVQGEESG